MFDTVQKQEEYRQPVWDAVDQLLNRPKQERRVVILDTGKALETAYLLSRGYKAPYIHVVNRSPQHIAWVKRRHPKVWAHPRELSAVITQMTRIGQRLDVVSFDGMGVVGSRRMPDTLATIVPLLSAGTVLTITITGGMEWKAKRYLKRSTGRTLTGWPEALPDWHASDLNRLDYLVSLVNFGGRKVQHMRVGRYVSSTNPSLHMVWAVMYLGVGRQRRVELF